MRKRKKKKKVVKVLLGVFLLGPLIFLGMFQCNSKLFAIAVETAHMDMKNMANIMIDESVEESIRSMGISSSDFFLESAKNPGVITANTLLINQFCSDISNQINQEIKKVGRKEIPVSLGSLSGIDFFSARGPNFYFSIYPVGAADVDYDTSFSSVGINQVNFKIWLDVSMQMKIVNPLQQRNIDLTRKIMLVDTVLSGTVPESYLNFTPSANGY
ncbi:MAG: hypothetical protein GX299_00515 [Epulopiscium sp.]|nr:hypothetical protein [Candidatus Epulonipiscium sp.]